MKYWLVLVQWMVLVTAMAAPVKAPRKPAPPGNRFLFILETSLPMSRLEHGGRQAVFDLIYSGVEGRMRTGDTYGVWTFNEQLSAGVYPMQTWEAQKKLEHASFLGRFLKTQNYAKDGDFTNVLKQLQGVARVAKDLNVFIVTDGNTLLSGTPFDAEVNASYRTHAAQVRETKKPLITTLVARNGEFTGATVTIAGEDIILADLPPQANQSVEIARAAPAAGTNEVAAPSAKKPVGQVVSVSEVEAEAEAQRVKAAKEASFVQAEAVTPAKAEPPAPVEQPKPEVVTTIAAPEPKVAEPLAMPVTTPVSAKGTNVVSTPIKAPGPAVKVAVVATNEALVTKPGPLPAIVPAQMTVSAATAGEAIRTPLQRANGNLMLMVGGVFVGASLVGAAVFARRMRKTRQPSFISQGMER